MNPPQQFLFALSIQTYQFLVWVNLIQVVKWNSLQITQLHFAGRTACAVKDCSSWFTKFVSALLNWLYFSRLSCREFVNRDILYPFTTHKYFRSFFGIFNGSRKYSKRPPNGIFGMIFLLNYILTAECTFHSLVQGEIHGVSISLTKEACLNLIPLHFFKHEITYISQLAAYTKY